MTKSIPVYKHGQVIARTVVDADDYETLASHRWHLNRGYVIRWESDRGKTVNIMMHREILSCPSGSQVDHLNHDRLDNRRSNLRIVNNAQNHQNRRHSPLRGVARDGRRWVAQCKVNGVRHIAGRFDTPEQAAAAAAALRQELMPYATN